jgi:hypothetical protein
MNRKKLIALATMLLTAALVVSSSRTQVRGEGRSQNNCLNVSGQIFGQIIGLNALCGGALTEIGTFTDDTGQTLGSFVACVSGLEQSGDGALKLQLVHTFVPDEGGTFTTSDRVVLSPVSPPLFVVNNRADITGGTEDFQDAYGFLSTHGTADLSTGVLSLDYHGRVCTP